MLRWIAHLDGTKKLCVIIIGEGNVEIILGVLNAGARELNRKKPLGQVLLRMKTMSDQMVKGNSRDKA